MGPVAQPYLSRPLVAHMRGERSFDGPAWEAYERLPHRIVTVSRSIQDRLGATGRRKAVAIYNGTRDVAGQRTPRPRPPKTARRSREGELTVAAFASVVPFKGCHHLMDALALLNARGWRDRLTVLWIGDAPPEHRRYQDWLERKRLALGLDNFRLLGWQPNPFPYYRSVNLTVLPSVSEEQLQLDDGSIEVRGARGCRAPTSRPCATHCRWWGPASRACPSWWPTARPASWCRPPIPPPWPTPSSAWRATRPCAAAWVAAGRERILSQFSTATYVERMVALYRELCLR